jgi:hypothetical protein
MVVKINLPLKMKNYKLPYLERPKKRRRNKKKKKKELSDITIKGSCLLDIENGVVILIN